MHIDSLGYSRIILKSDGEAAIIAVCEMIKALRSCETISVPERSPVGEHPSNGDVERAIKTVAAQFRTMRDHIEHRIGSKIEHSNPILQWLIVGAASIISRYAVGSDGKTAYERVRNRKCSKAVAVTGEVVHFREVRGEGRTRKSEVQWRKGVWLGVDPRAGETLIGTSEGVLRAHAIRRVRDEEKWDKAVVDALQGTLEHPVPGVNGDVPVAIRHRVEAEVPAQDVRPRFEETPIRRMKLFKELFDQHGYTLLCPGCTALRAGTAARTHRDACRARIEAALQETEEGRETLRRNELRIDGQLAERVEIGEPPAEAPVEMEGPAPEAEIPAPNEADEEMVGPDLDNCDVTEM